MFSTLEKIKDLAKKKGISLAKLEETLGYSTNYFYTLKTKAPNAERLAEIANYFNVSTDYLLGRTDNPKIADSQLEWQGAPVNVEDMASNVMMFGGRELTDEKKKIIQSIIEGYLREAGD
ncbi:helix-turn-helix domain-containing protein [Streptococcus suis]|uniref:helix-turn-helix domain-containing protein n=1 Tax=Streptococcus suis TaxID=1307 RepID=UPI0038B925FD